jgi:hypothetical protein
MKCLIFNIFNYYPPPFATPVPSEKGGAKLILFLFILFFKGIPILALSFAYNFF